LNGGTFIADALDSRAVYTATVTAATPEPSEYVPMSILLAVLALFRECSRNRGKTAPS
jgi:hypothetical protein